jgi:predicted Mrr-cat superfamily restriction endonuclease
MFNTAGVVPTGISEEADMTGQAWVIRAGGSGEREQWVLDNSVAGGGFSEIPSLAEANTVDDVRAIVERTLPTKSKAFVGNHAGQLWSVARQWHGAVLM